MESTSVFDYCCRGRILVNMQYSRVINDEEREGDEA
jgi:hypothetical protein